LHTSDTDTIVAVATAEGEAAIGIVRLSGPEAVLISGRCYRGARQLGDSLDRHLCWGRFIASGEELDEILVAVMRGPRSFTGEDTVEIYCHGGPHLLRRAREALVREGARPAERGEFTRRAFLNGRIDLTQAEAVADMISAGSDLGLQSAYFQLRGGLRERFESLGEDLRQAATLLEVELDFSDDVMVDRAEVRKAMARARGEMEGLIRSYRTGKIIRQGARVILAGRPNVGKSSLLNRLLEQDRAIVTPVPGTTRDTIEESVDLDGIRVVLVDTAGLRAAQDAVEEEGTRRSRLSIEGADLVLLVLDGSEGPREEDRSLLAGTGDRPRLLVVNKVDLGHHPDWQLEADREGRVATSALTGEGLDALRESIRARVLEGEPSVGGQGVITHERHVLALVEALEALSRAQKAVDLPGEIVAMELHDALNALGAIVGQTTPEDVLDRIFSTFCIGK
jgi:tRNA modification GTPase